ncbi:hypothetical protein ZWY2020_025176 [Hordeum vulgare]|nr:hypothetical protein ZWY2020_025176 [Hordeum vulgare]
MEGRAATVPCTAVGGHLDGRAPVLPDEDPRREVDAKPRLGMCLRHCSTRRMLRDAAGAPPVCEEGEWLCQSLRGREPTRPAAGRLLAGAVTSAAGVERLCRRRRALYRAPGHRRLRVPVVYQGHDDVEVWSPVLSGPSVPFAPNLADALAKDVQAGYLILQVKIDGHARWKVGSWISGHYHIFVTCHAFLIGAGATARRGPTGSDWSSRLYSYHPAALPLEAAAPQEIQQMVGRP